MSSPSVLMPNSYDGMITNVNGPLIHCYCTSNTCAWFLYSLVDYWHDSWLFLRTYEHEQECCIQPFRTMLNLRTWLSSSALSKIRTYMNLICSIHDPCRLGSNNSRIDDSHFYYLFIYINSYLVEHSYNLIDLLTHCFFPYIYVYVVLYFLDYIWIWYIKELFVI